MQMKCKDCRHLWVTKLRHQYCCKYTVGRGWLQYSSAELAYLKACNGKDFEQKGINNE